jgi:hypothetical protein
MKEPLFVRSLTGTERTALRTGLRSPQAFTRRRSQLLLLSAAGKTPRQSARQLGFGKLHTQQNERKHLTLRTRIKRLARKTLCFSKSVFMHDTVIGLYVNRYEFGVPV